MKFDGFKEVDENEFLALVNSYPNTIDHGLISAEKAEGRVYYDYSLSESESECIIAIELYYEGGFPKECHIREL